MKSQAEYVRDAVTSNSRPVSQFSKPTGWLGRYMLWRMNSHHSKLTDWGLDHVAIGSHFTILDVGCGGGRTVNKLAAIATQGKVYGIDHSDESLAATRRMNARWIDLGRVEVRHGCVSQMPFSDDLFDLVTAVEHTTSGLTYAQTCAKSGESLSPEVRLSSSRKSTKERRE